MPFANHNSPWLPDFHEIPGTLNILKKNHIFHSYIDMLIYCSRNNFPTLVSFFHNLFIQKNTKYLIITRAS